MGVSNVSGNTISSYMVCEVHGRIRCRILVCYGLPALPAQLHDWVQPEAELSAANTWPLRINGVSTSIEIGAIGVPVGDSKRWEGIWDTEGVGNEECSSDQDSEYALKRAHGQKSVGKWGCRSLK